jgi:NTE family protein
MSGRNGAQGRDTTVNDTLSETQPNSDGATPTPTPLSAPPRPRRRPGWRDYTAFVLSSGGARGAVQVGSLKALVEHGITPDVIVGTSIGSWNGAVLAMEPNADGVEKLAKIWRGLSTSSILLGWEPHLPTAASAFAGAYAVAAIRRVTLGYPSLYGDAGLRRLFNVHLAGSRFEDTQVPFRVIASNLSSGGIRVFGRGRMELALLASAAIPGIFPPVRIGGEIYVDGGALESSSLDAAIEMGARRIFVIDAGYEVTPELEDELQALIQRAPRATRQANAHALAVILERTATMMGRFQLDRALARAPEGIEIHVLRPSSTMNEAALDFDHAANWIELAYEQARAYLGAHLPTPAQPAPSPSDRLRAEETPLIESTEAATLAAEQRAG